MKRMLYRIFTMSEKPAAVIGEYAFRRKSGNCQRRNEKSSACKTTEYNFYRTVIHRHNAYVFHDILARGAAHDQPREAGKQHRKKQRNDKQKQPEQQIYDFRLHSRLFHFGKDQNRRVKRLCYKVQVQNI